MLKVRKLTVILAEIGEHERELTKAAFDKIFKALGIVAKYKFANSMDQLKIQVKGGFFGQPDIVILSGGFEFADKKEKWQIINEGERKIVNADDLAVLIKNEGFSGLIILVSREPESYRFDFNLKILTTELRSFPISFMTQVRDLF